jgi:hypothetical protein
MFLFKTMTDFIKKHTLLLLFLILITTFFTRNNFKGIRSIAPEVLEQPYQHKIDNPQLIKFQNNGYAYEVTPVYSYEINALIVSKMNYKVFSIEKFAKIFPYDLCLIWGGNISSGTYKNKTLQFSQDCRWCFARLYGNVKFNWDEFSNSHLLINSSALEKQARSLVVGDQVKIKGRLVNVKARLIGTPDSFNALEYQWNSGVGKIGLGAGACKVIYVEKLEVLRKANIVSDFLFHLSLYGLFILIIWKALYFFGIIGNRDVYN